MVVQFPNLILFTGIAGQVAVILGEGAASTPAQVQDIMNQRSFVFGTEAGLPQDFPTTVNTGCGGSPTPPTPPSPTPPTPATGNCSSYTQKSDCNNAINCVWSGHPQSGTCGDGSGSPPTDTNPPPSPTPGGCTTCSGLTGGACKSCPNCSWSGNQGCS